MLRALAWLPLAVRFAVFSLVLVLVSGHGSRDAGFVFRRGENQLGLERYVEKLGPETLVAGWPDDPMSNLAWVSGRQAFMTGEMHIPHHKGYLERLRPRLYDFFAAYLAHEPKDVLAFADKYHVTHFMLDMRHFGGRPPGYMPPFGAKVVERHREGRRRGGFALHRLAPQLTVSTHGPFRLVSMARLREHVAATDTVTPGRSSATGPDRGGRREGPTGPSRPGTGVAPASSHE